ncbi:MAG: penicillin-binding transpeptidase domain-containing protein [Phycisphaerae bacterium]|nr:penicillin-binding transpeptidase domain-containing protein [Phycisphaerae bacterium]
MEGIDELKLQQGVSRQLQTIRGKILDRKGRVLATNEPQFQLHINYTLCCLFDERVRRAKLLTVAERSMLAKEKPSLYKVRKELDAKLEILSKIIYKCSFFGQGQLDIEEQIASINNRIWNLRTFLAWRRNDPDPKIIAKYGRVSNVPLSVAIEDFEKKFPDVDQRLLLIEEIQKIPEMNKGWRLLELKTDADVFDAQLEFMDIEGIEILPKESRSYPYGSVAAQIIGWVGPPQKSDMQLFANDKLSRYISDEVCGREDGVEYICETILRGRRGEKLWDIDRELISRTETQFGKDVTTTLDIELQKKIEDHLADCILNPNCQAPMAAVVIDVNTGDILALVSTPTFDLNHVRLNYNTLISDSNEPLRNRAINKGYPPGSVVKPLILIAGLQSGKITAGEPISCPAAKAPRGWPSCWIFNQYRSGHDYKWQNNARNAVRGSCNIYFSRLADRIEPSVLQLWLFKFGYAQEISLTIPHPPSSIENRASGIENRNLRQVAGTISSTAAKTPISRLDQIPALDKGERRYFGIGQGNLRATPLQVANAMAAIARGGVYKPPRLFLDPRPTSSENQEPGIDLNISPQTIAVVHDGMSAVVNELSGTANTQFLQSSLIQEEVKVYGKTGSTQAPENAWFAGFATDNTGRSIAIAVLVEGGQRGSQDAAPLGFEIIQFCIDTEYIGPTQSIIE